MLDSHSSYKSHTEICRLTVFTTEIIIDQDQPRGGGGGVLFEGGGLPPLHRPKKNLKSYNPETSMSSAVNAFVHAVFKHSQNVLRVKSGTSRFASCDSHDSTTMFCSSCVALLYEPEIKFFDRVIWWSRSPLEDSSGLQMACVNDCWISLGICECWVSGPDSGTLSRQWNNIAAFFALTAVSCIAAYAPGH